MGSLKQGSKMSQLKFFLLLSVCVVLTNSNLAFEDCESATTECCNLAVENIKAKKFNIKGNCESYWKNKARILANSKTSYECKEGWICDCPDFEKKFEAQSTWLLEKEADKHCADSRPQPQRAGSSFLAISWAVCGAALLALTLQ